MKFLKLFDIKQLKSDKCVFRSEVEKEEVFLDICVDDGLILSKSNAVINKVLVEFGLQFEITIAEDPY